jgi:hypothetical protein
LQKNWAPATRFLVGSCALGMGACASLGGGLRAMMWDAIAAALLVEAVREPHRRSQHAGPQAGAASSQQRSGSQGQGQRSQPRWPSTELPPDSIPLAKPEDVKTPEPPPGVTGAYFKRS